MATILAEAPQKFWEPLLLERLRKNPDMRQAQVTAHSMEVIVEYNTYSYEEYQKYETSHLTVTLDISKRQMKVNGYFQERGEGKVILDDSLEWGGEIFKEVWKNCREFRLNAAENLQNFANTLRLKT